MCDGVLVLVLCGTVFIGLYDLLVSDGMAFNPVSQFLKLLVRMIASRGIKIFLCHMKTHINTSPCIIKTPGLNVSVWDRVMNAHGAFA